MRIICPTCASHYDIDPGKIPAAGQLVRCAQCREVWLVRASDRAPAPALGAPRPDAARASPLPWIARPQPYRAITVQPSDRAVEPIDFHRAKARLRPRIERSDLGQSAGGTLAGLVAGTVCLAALMATVGMRTAIVDRLPQTAPLFAAMGLPVSPTGLALRDVHSALVAEGGRTVLMLQGEIANLRDGTADVPPLRVVVRGAEQTPLYTWTATASKGKLAKGETVVFRSRLAAPPAEGRDVRVSFADAGDLAAGPMPAR